MSIEEKIYQNYDDRIETLRKRNMTISKKSSKHRSVIKNYNYYNVINGYKDLFLINTGLNEKYKDGTTPNELFALFKFDERLRIIVLEFLLPIEERLKHCITQSFYEHHLNRTDLDDEDKKKLHRESVYLRKEFYNCKNIKNNVDSEKEKTYKKFYKIANEQINFQYYKGNESIKKYKDEHQYIPMWVLFNILMFGNMSKLFSILPVEIKKDVMQKMGMKWNFQLEDETIKQFEFTLEILTLARNRSAHNERLYTFKHNMPLKDRFLSFRDALPSINDIKFPNRSEMKFGIFSVLFLITKFSSEKDSKKMIKLLSREIEILEKELKVINSKDVLKLMNMNHDWEDFLHSTI